MQQLVAAKNKMNETSGYCNWKKFFGGACKTVGGERGGGGYEPKLDQSPSLMTFHFTHRLPPTHVGAVSIHLTCEQKKEASFTSVLLLRLFDPWRRRSAETSSIIHKFETHAAPSRAALPAALIRCFLPSCSKPTGMQAVRHKTFKVALGRVTLPLSRCHLCLSYAKKDVGQEVGGGELLISFKWSQKGLDVEREASSSQNFKRPLRFVSRTRTIQTGNFPFHSFVSPQAAKSTNAPRDELLSSKPNFSNF